MEYFYMFSDGSYSDYCVGGLYKSKLKLTEEDFKVYKKQLLQEYLASVGLYGIEIDSECGNWSLKNKIYTEVAGDRPQTPSWDLNESVGPVRAERVKREYLEWHKKEVAFFETNPLLTLTQWLCEKGILEAIEYEEMHEIE